MNQFTPTQSELASGSTQSRHVPGAYNRGMQPGSAAPFANADFATTGHAEAHETSDPTRDGEGVPTRASGGDPYLTLRNHNRTMTIQTLLAYHGRTRENATRFAAMTDRELSEVYKEMTE